MVGSCVGEASHWLHVPFVRWGPTFRPMLLRMREIPASSSSIDGGNRPYERQLTPMFSPTASHGEGRWWWCSPLEFISGLDMRSEQMLTLAVGNRADLLDKCWVLNVQVQPGTGHVFWRGQEMEQRLRGPNPIFVPDPEGEGSEEEGEAEDDEVEQPGEEEGGKKGGRKTHEEEEAERRWSWIRKFAPVHPSELSQDLDATVTYVTTRSEFVARFITDDFPKDYPKGFRLHQKTRSSKPSIVGSYHDDFRIVLLWLWQKYGVFTQGVTGVTRMPSHVRRMLEPRHGPKLLPCPASGWRSKARQSESSECQCFS